jgi:hypothetical protein
MAGKRITTLLKEMATAIAALALGCKLQKILNNYKKQKMKKTSTQTVACCSDILQGCSFPSRYREAL